MNWFIVLIPFLMFLIICIVLQGLIKLDLSTFHWQLSLSSLEIEPTSFKWQNEKVRLTHEQALHMTMTTFR